jgi:hypothetical protein
MSNSPHCGCASAASGPETDRQYAAKLVCGILAPSKPKSSGPLSPGQYFTAINVHNPSRCETVEFRWKVAVGNPLESREHPVSAFANASLGPDEALEIDTADVMQLLNASFPPQPFVKGWVVLETESELDVVAVYTSSQKTGLPATTFHTERVPARCLPRCADLGFNLSTGVAPWLVRSANTQNFTIATLGRDPDAGTAWTDLDGALWIRPATSANETDFLYQLCFDLCSGFLDPVLELNLLADNFARAELNGHLLAGPNYSTAHPWHTATGANAFRTPGAATASPQMFRAGRNCLTVTVRNASGPSGLALSGFLEAGRARCPGSPEPRLACPSVNYRAHVADFLLEDDHGWLPWVANGATAGTTGQNRRLEAFEVNLSGAPPGTAIRYRGHLAHNGWTSWVNGGDTCGTTGQGRRMEAIQIELVNKPLHCRLRYRVHMRRLGWSAWTNEGAIAGTTGQNRRIEAIEIAID